MSVLTDIGPGPFGLISPHLDDAALSCGSLLSRRPGCAVVTVITGGRRPDGTLADWDRRSGFGRGDDVWAARKTEDATALGLVGARAYYLDFPDVQYRVPPVRFASFRSRALRKVHLAREASDGDLAITIEEHLSKLIDSLHLRTWFIPLGLGHPDHRMIGRVCSAIAAKSPERDWVAYVDLPYGAKSPELVGRAHERLRIAGFSLLPVDGHFGGESCKRQMVESYRSQLKPLGKDVEIAIAATETYTRLVRHDVGVLLTP